MSRLDTRGCRRERPALLAWIDGELDTDARLRFEGHLDSCASCAAAARHHLLLEELLHLDAGLEPDADFDDRVVAGVFARIDRAGDGALDPPAGLAEAPPGTRLRLTRTAATAAAAAAFVLAGLALLDLRLFGSRSSGRFDAPETPPVAGAPDASAERLPRRDPSPASSAAAPSPARTEPLPAAAPAEDGIVPSRLAAARATVEEAILFAEEAEDYRAAFLRRTSALRADAWPVEEIVVGAIDSADAGAAERAIRAAAELSLERAVPALRRATRRQDVAGAALVALGALRDDRSFALLCRSLETPDLREDAAWALARLGTDDAARALASALDHEAAAEAAGRALLSMGSRGAGELLLRRAEGDTRAAALLEGDARPTPEEVLELLDAERVRAEVVAEAIAAAPAVGPDALPSLRRLLAAPSLAPLAAAALVEIGGEAALLHLATAEPPPAPAAGAPSFEAVVGNALRRLVEQDPSAADAVARVAASGGRAAGERIVRALDAASDGGARGLAAVFADRSAAPASRSAAAVRLAAADRFDAASGLAAVFELALVDEDAAADVLCAALRTSGAPPDPAALAPLARSHASRLLSRAGVVADRWRSDGVPPRPWERRGLVRILARAVPRL